ncbi:MAG TPA: hypothetical protein PK781_04615 [Terrimesophilobacter sp.]|nr:hypothetical protein [Terrimesophilobacter sp.]
MATRHPPAPEQQLSPVQFSRLAHRGILLGLSISQLIVLGIGVVTVVATIYTGGGMGLVWTSPIWLICLLLAVVPVGGRKLVDWLPIVSRWVWRSTAGQLIFRRRVIKPRPVGTLALPGDATALREWVEEWVFATNHASYLEKLSAERLEELRAAFGA